MRKDVDSLLHRLLTMRTKAIRRLHLEASATGTAPRRDSYVAKTRERKSYADVAAGRPKGGDGTAAAVPPADTGKAATYSTKRASGAPTPARGPTPGAPGHGAATATGPSPSGGHPKKRPSGGQSGKRQGGAVGDGRWTGQGKPAAGNKAAGKHAGGNKATGKGGGGAAPRAPAAQATGKPGQTTTPQATSPGSEASAPSGPEGGAPKGGRRSGPTAAERAALAKALSHAELVALNKSHLMTAATHPGEADFIAKAESLGMRLKTVPGTECLCQVLAIIQSMTGYLPADAAPIRKLVDETITQLLARAVGAYPYNWSAVLDSFFEVQVVDLPTSHGGGVPHAGPPVHVFASNIAEALSARLNIGEREEHFRQMTEVGEGMLIALLYGLEYVVYRVDPATGDVVAASSYRVTYRGQTPTKEVRRAVTVIRGNHYWSGVSLDAADGVNLAPGCSRALKGRQLDKILAAMTSNQRTMIGALEQHCRTNRAKFSAIANQLQAAMYPRGRAPAPAPAGSGGSVHVSGSGTQSQSSVQLGTQSQLSVQFGTQSQQSVQLGTLSQQSSGAAAADPPASAHPAPPQHSYAGRKTEEELSEEDRARQDADASASSQQDGATLDTSAAQPLPDLSLSASSSPASSLHVGDSTDAEDSPIDESHAAPKTGTAKPTAKAAPAAAALPAAAPAPAPAAAPAPAPAALAASKKPTTGKASRASSSSRGSSTSLPASAGADASAAEAPAHAAPAAEPATTAPAPAAAAPAAPAAARAPSTRRRGSGTAASAEAGAPTGEKASGAGPHAGATAHPPLPKRGGPPHHA